MAAIAHGRQTAFDAGSPFSYSTDGVYQTVLTVSAGSFVGGGKYLLLAMLGSLSGGATTISAFAKVVHGSTDFPGSEMNQETVNAGATVNGQQYLFSTVFEQPGTPEDILIQVATETAGTTVDIFAASLTWIRLDDDLVENTDWYYNELATDDPMSTSFETRATITIDDPGTWLIIAYESGNYDANGAINVKIVEDPAGTPVDLSGVFSIGPKDTNDFRTFPVFASRVLASGSVTIAVQDQDPGGTAQDHLHSSIFAINLDKFDQSVVGFDADALTPSTSGVDITPDGWSDPTPNVTGDWMAVGFSILDYDATGVGGSQWIEFDGAGALTQYPGAARQLHGAQATYEPGAVSVYLASLASGGARSIDLETDWAGTVGTATIKNRFLAAFSMELAGGAPPPGRVQRLAALGVG